MGDQELNTVQDTKKYETGVIVLVIAFLIFISVVFIMVTITFTASTDELAENKFFIGCFVAGIVSFVTMMVSKSYVTRLENKAFAM